LSNIRTTFKTRYGLDWDPEVHDVFIDLTLAKKARLEPFNQGNLLVPGEHMLRAARALFTNDEWNISPWTEQHCHAFCNYDGSIWVGSASCSKSNDAGFLLFLYWLTDPLDTYVAMGSTSVSMLKLRSFESVTRCFRVMKKNNFFDIPGKEAPSQTAIINSTDDGTEASLKASIRGVALKDGDEASNIARLAGSHLRYTALCLDEGSALPPAAAKARVNAAMGAQRFVFLSLANPVSFNDEATRLAEPVDGWASVNERTPEWMSIYGFKVLHHNGFDSPAVIEPDGAKRYPHLINQEQIDRALRETGGNPDDQIIWTMVRGYPAPQGNVLSVLTDTDIRNFELSSPAVFDTRNHEIVRVAGLDPAFSSGNDGCAWRYGEVGYDKEGRYVLNLRPVELFPLNPSSAEPIAYQIVRLTLQRMRENNIPIQNLAVDDSGTQSIASIIHKESGQMPMYCNFASAASDPKSWRNLITEMWFFIQALARGYQLKGLDSKTASQFCGRRFKNALKPLALEGKDEYKKRSAQRSPDEADGTALLAHAAKLRCGLTPGSTRPGTIDNGFQPPYSENPQTSYEISIDSAMSSGYDSFLY